MAYATNLEFAEQSGLGLRIIDENVGTGDNSETDFDLDNINVISNSYTLSHAVSGSNNFTTLTETTHYTLDKESGKIILTAGGVTEVGTDIIYATYWYTDNFSDSIITGLIGKAQDEIDKLTNKKWDTPISTSSYFNGKPTLGYPRTNRPYVTDYDKPDGILLPNQPATVIDNVYFLSLPLTITQFWNFDDGTSVYTDKTTEINSTTESPFTLFDVSPATNDFIYIGSSNRFLGLDVSLSTIGTDNGTTAIDWEYWDGSSWVDLNETDVNTGASIFTVSGRFIWSYPYGWTKNIVNNSESLYFIRGKLTDDYSVDPVVSTITLRDSINEVVEQRNLLLENSTIYFHSKEIPSGVRNIRVDYQYGTATTPSYITDLAILIAAVDAYINLSGGSYDAATSYSLGSKSVTIGEQYVNIREVISQFKTRIDELLKLVGRRAEIAVI